MINPIAKQEREEKHRQKVAETIDNCLFLIQTAPEFARARRAMYDAYLDEGFTPEQALILCK